MAKFPSSYTKKQAAREIAEFQKALEEGVHRSVDGKIKAPYSIAAERLGVSRNTFRDRIGSAKVPGSITRTWPDLKVDWSKRPEVETVVVAQEPVDVVKLRRFQDENALMRSRLKTMEQRCVGLEDWRESILGLRALPEAPVSFPARTKSAGERETVVVFLSDLHWSEHVSLAAMDGLNSYNLTIARNRLGRWANAVCDLINNHWSGLAPDRLIIVLGGDLVSGGIHADFLKTDELQPLPAVRDVSDHLQAAILRISQNISCPIDVISLPGNHGRSTFKPESKNVSSTSYDMLVSDFLEMGLKARKGISFYAPVSPDALFSVYGYHVLATHGDRIGSRGGQGFIGPAATAARGFKRIIADYAARGVHVDMIMIGHFHTALMLEEGFVNDSLVGPSEFSRDGRFRPRPAKQLFLVIHPRRFVSQVRWIEVGHPSEGSLYAAPAVDRPLRPRFSIKD